MDLSLKNLEQAVSLRRQIDSLEKRFASLIGGGTIRTASRGRSRPAGQRRVSAATRAKLAAAAKARWAKQKGGKGTARAGGAKKKGGLTAAGRRRLSQRAHCFPADQGRRVSRHRHDV